MWARSRGREVGGEGEIGGGRGVLN
jgi:hypothetical protein